ncbi:helix-turn-helix domain-containing protein [Intrasporangium sp. YIM S08009]|uniref:arsenate reductase/protein-tyrosine-phosphatase family protein n=1 Tax=Intrasporangium zincisolvens TaxID=3080018 RepID=UPI002B05F018|nr:helix-turn-helix domain-containing protein [Intrasporangium sp. YIM S08009]
MNTEQTSGLERRVRAHAALADITRLRIVDRLSVSDAAASELGALLDVPSNLLAHHLKVLQDAGLITRHRSEGDGRRTYVTLVPAAVSAVSTPVGALAQPSRVLFVCTANTARSHLAAALWRRTSPIVAASAGTHPGDRINERAAAAAARHGLDLPEVAPAMLADIEREGDLVITVCDRAHEELHGADWAHWSIPDPVPSGGARAFDRALELIAGRVSALAPRFSAAG